MEIKLICPTLLNCELLKMRALVTEFYTTNGNKINFPHPTQLLLKMCVYSDGIIHPVTKYLRFFPSHW